MKKVDKEQYGLTISDIQQIRDAVFGLSERITDFDKNKKTADQQTLYSQNSIVKSAYQKADEIIRKIASEKITQISDGFKANYISHKDAPQYAEQLGKRMAEVIHVASKTTHLPEKYQLLDMTGKIEADLQPTTDSGQNILIRVYNKTLEEKKRGR